MHNGHMYALCFSISIFSRINDTPRESPFFATSALSGDHVLFFPTILYLYMCVTSVEVPFFQCVPVCVMCVNFFFFPHFPSSHLI